jgi:hypothetical protein
VGKAAVFMVALERVQGEVGPALVQGSWHRYVEATRIGSWQDYVVKHGFLKNFVPGSVSCFERPKALCAVAEWHKIPRRYTFIICP